MSEFFTIPGLDQPLVELLEAAGLRNMKDLSEADEHGLTQELARANRILKIAQSAPSQETVADWVRLAREQTRLPEEEPVLEIVNHERVAKVATMLRSSPVAISLPANALKDKGLSVPDIPPGLLLSEYPGELDIRTEKRIPKTRAEGLAQLPYFQISDSQIQSKLDIYVSRLKSIDHLGPVKTRVHASPSADTEDRVALIRAPKSSTNEGRNPESRRFIRGVLHSHPYGLYTGAILTVLLFLVVPTAVVAALLLLLSREIHKSFDWVDEWWLVFPVALPVLALGWAVWGLSGMCRVCGQRLFIHRPHRKNAKAHHVNGLGYVLPLCIHILLFRWFRCSHCGTPIRLKK
jgi:hypothetical protein